MRRVTYSMGVSLDGYIVGPDGDFDWTVPDEQVFRFWIDEIRDVGVHLLGRRLYETMLYWETADQDPSLDDSELEWAAIWKPLPKVVFSTTLSAVQGNARLASGGLAEEIERLRADPGEGDIAIGGATLAAEAAGLGLIDEYRLDGLPGAGWRRHPVLSPARAPGGSRTRRDPHLQLESGLPPLPRGALAPDATSHGLQRSRRGGLPRRAAARPGRRRERLRGRDSARARWWSPESPPGAPDGGAWKGRITGGRRHRRRPQRDGRTTRSLSTLPRPY